MAYDIYTKKQADFGDGMKLYHFYGMKHQARINARLVLGDGTIDTISNPDFTIPMGEYRQIAKPYRPMTTVH